MLFLIPAAWKQLRHHPKQQELWRCKSRTVVVCAGRQSGKTELARRRVVTYLQVKKPWPDPRYFYALPTYGQAQKVAWPQILSLIPKSWLAREPSESKMVIETIFGSKLYVLGLDKPARIEGPEWDGGVVDESSDQRPGIMRSIRPALAVREGWLWRIGVPKRYGPGAREFKAAYELGMRGEAGHVSFTWPSWEVIRQEEIEILRSQLDAKDFNEQIGGNWVDAGGLAYYAFSDDNIRAVTYKENKPVIVMSDFNVDPMAWCLAHLVDTPHGQGFEVFDEIWLRNTNTQATLDHLYNRYSSHRGGWVFVGDATGRARKTAATKSDYKQILNDKRFMARVRYPKKNPLVKDRLAAVNVLSRNAAGQVRLWVDPRCVHLIDDLRNRALNEYGEPQPAEQGVAHDSGHMTDALGYGVWKYFPVQLESQQGSNLVVVGEF